MATETKIAERAPTSPPPKVQPPPTAETTLRAETEQLDKLRDVLYGSQLRENDRRYARLDERLQREIAALRLEMTTRLGALEKHIGAELASCVARLAQEAKERQTALEDVRGTVAKNERDGRQATLELAKTLSSELHRVHEELTSELAAEVHALQSGKVERSDLASMLGEVIMRLNSGIEDIGHVQ